MTATEPQFTEDWFCEESQAVLADLCRQVRYISGAIIEVGSWEGRSTIALAKAAWPDRITAVDTWRGSPGEISSQLAADRDVYATFRANLVAAGVTNVDVYRNGWRDYFHRYRRPIRLLFIDAEHTYREVFDNIAAAKPMMVNGGIMCGDDAHHPPVREAVADHFPHAQVQATLWWVQL